MLSGQSDSSSSTPNHTSSTTVSLATSSSDLMPPTMLFSTSPNTKNTNSITTTPTLLPSCSLNFVKHSPSMNHSSLAPLLLPNSLTSPPFSLPFVLNESNSSHLSTPSFPPLPIKATSLNVSTTGCLPNIVPSPKHSFPATPLSSLLNINGYAAHPPPSTSLSPPSSSSSSSSSTTISLGSPPTSLTSARLVASPILSRKQRKSFVWRYFQFINNEAICIVPSENNHPCHRRFKYTYKTGCSTGNLIRHLFVNHRIEPPSITSSSPYTNHSRKSKQAPNSLNHSPSAPIFFNSVAETVPQLTQETFQLYLSRLISENVLSFDAVHSSLFKRFLLLLNSDVRHFQYLPSHYDIMFSEFRSSPAFNIIAPNTSVPRISHKDGCIQPLL